MKNHELLKLLDDLLVLLSQHESPADLDVEQMLMEAGCTPAKAELLADYLPTACGRAFLREIGMKPSATYQRPNADGSWGAPTAFSDDPLWKEVEAFVETIRADPTRRKQFGIAARLSAEADAVNNAINSGRSLEDLAGSTFASVFVAPLKHQG